jgi:vacuolar-type H+-ATPase subunit C/Vma6
MAAAGSEPVIGYVMARQAEVTMVRTLLIGRMSGVPSEVLRRRLRVRYGRDA